MARSRGHPHRAAPWRPSQGNGASIRVMVSDNRAHGTPITVTCASLSTVRLSALSVPAPRVSTEHAI